MPSTPAHSLSLSHSLTLRANCPQNAFISLTLRLSINAVRNVSATTQFMLRGRCKLCVKLGVQVCRPKHWSGVIYMFTCVCVWCVW